MKNIMQEIRIEKMVLNVGGTADKLEKGAKLLKVITDKKPMKIKSKKRIPSWGVRPNLEVGAKVTLRKKQEIFPLLKRLLEGIENKLKDQQIEDNHLSFGIKEYIEIPDIEYHRDIGILGFEVDIMFSRKGGRVKRKKIKRGKLPKKQAVTKEEIINFMKKNFNLEVEEK